MTHPLGVDGLVELAVRDRSGFDESRHLGAAVVVRPDGSVLAELGDGGGAIYPRSALKPLQATAVQRAGAGLSGVALVLASASHRGTPRHAEVVRGMLTSAGLSEHDLRCPLDWPLDPDARRASPAASRLAMNCSGKHASFLLACRASGWPIETYLDPGHPLQRLVRATVEDFAGEPVAHVGVDGCGAPVFALTLGGLARAIARVATDPECAELCAAIREHPWAIDSPAVATAIERLGVVAKAGADGVFVAAAPDGTAVAVKVADGSMAPGLPVGLTLLQRAGALPADAVADVLEQVAEPVLGGGAPVGSLRVTA